MLDHSTCSQLEHVRSAFQAVSGCKASRDRTTTHYVRFRCHRIRPGPLSRCFEIGCDRVELMDERPRLAEAFRLLRAGRGPVWITWRNKRLLLGLPDDAWLALARGRAVIATRRGYRSVELAGRLADGGHLMSKRGVAKHQPIRIAGDYFRPISAAQVRAVILEEHDR